jgi:DNA-binding MarR family transcriptional regulator
MDDHFGFLAGDVARLMRKRLDAVSRGSGVTGAQWRVLLHVLRSPGVNQGTLAERLEVEPITTCRMIDRLEQAGMIERRHDPADRRAWALHLTDAAAPLIDEMRVIGNGIIEDALHGLSLAEREQLSALLGRVRDNLAGAGSAPTEGQISHG